MNKLKIAAGLTAGLTLCGVADAALIERDWINVGDKLITYDSETGLEWLDVPVTQGLSFDSVRTKIAHETIYESFRYATAAEVRVLQDYIFPFLYVDNPTNDMQNNFDNVLDKLGATTIHNDGSRELDGFTGTPASATTQVNAYFIQGSTGGFINLSSSEVISWASPYTTGSYLVREAVVPIPAAAYLFASGLLGIIGFGRRKVSRGEARGLLMG